MQYNEKPLSLGFNLGSPHPAARVTEHTLLKWHIYYYLIFCFVNIREFFIFGEEVSENVYLIKRLAKLSIYRFALDSIYVKSNVLSVIIVFNYYSLIISASQKHGEFNISF